MSDLHERVATAVSWTGPGTWVMVTNDVCAAFADWLRERADAQRHSVARFALNDVADEIDAEPRTTEA